MLKIAICDDEIEKGRQIDAWLNQCFNGKGIIYEKQLFSNSKALWYEIDDGTKFDLLLLDIEMPQLDGISLTEQIKTYLPDALVIFITSYEKYVYESFKVQPFRFIPKRYLKSMLPSALEDARNLLMKNQDRFLIAENQDGIEKIPTRSILYIWHREKYAYIERSNGETSKVRKTLKQVYEMLPEGDFVWIDRGCICNLAQISKITDGYIVLVNSMKLQGSRDRITEVKNIFRKYWTEDNR